TYLWSTGTNTVSLQGVKAGSYMLTVVDANGCRVISETKLITPPVLELVTEKIDNVTGYSLSNGRIKTEFKGGTLPYTYQWTDSTGKILSETSNTISGLIAGTYNLIIRDSKDCSLSFVYEVEQPDELEVSIEEKSIISCQGSNDGV
ncbi:SprB repeat-containing protein, partial [Tenacibaculum sp. S7007]|nr:SprB repeat-containing protein [Tenacibaculum pelagium]